MKKWQRRLTRFVGWWIAAFASLVAVILLAVSAYLLFFDYSETLRLRLEKELSRIAGAPARIGSIDLNLTGYAFELNDVSVAGVDGAEPILAVERVWGRLRFSEVAQLRLHWTELVVQGLTIHLVEGAEGGFRFPRDVTAPPTLTGAGMAFSADRVALENAELVLSNEKVPWQLEASNLGVELRRQGGDSYKGMVSYNDGVLVIKDHARIEGSVSAEIELSGGELFVHDARGQSELGSMSARGKVGLAGGVHGRFDVEAEGDVARTAHSVLGLDLDDAALTGAMQFKGSLSVTPGTKQLEGTLAWPAGEVHGIPMRNWSGALFWDRQLLQVSGARGALASGRARLELHQALPVSDHRAALEVDVVGASLAEVLAGARAGDSPVDSSLSGKASLSFPATSPDRVEGVFEITGTRPGVARGSRDGSSGVVPAGAARTETVDLKASGTIADGDIHLASMQIETATMSVSMSGVYPRDGSADILVDITSFDLARTDEVALGLRCLLRSGAKADPEPWGLAGRGRARGRLTARLPRPRFEGELTASAMGFDRLRFEELETRAVLSHGVLRFEDLLAHHADGVVAGAGTLSFEGPLGKRDFELQLRLLNWPLADVLTLVDTTFPSEGRASGDIDVRRRAGQLDGDATIDVVRPEVIGERFDRATVMATFRGTHIKVERASFFRGAARIAGALDLDIETGAVQGELSAQGFPLDGSVVDGLALTGALDASVALAGHVDAPMVELDAEARDVTLDGVPLGDATIAAGIENERFELDVRLGNELALDATGVLRARVPVSGTLRFNALDTGVWFARVSEPFSALTRVLTTGTATFDVELLAEGSLVAEASLTQVVVETDGIRFESLAPARARLEDGILRVPTLSLAEGDSRLVVGGVVDFDSKSLDVRVEGNTTFDIVETFYPSLAAAGALDVAARVSGRWDAPSLSGQAELNGASLRLRGFAQALGGLHGRFVFDNRTITIPELEGVFGSGPVVFSGAVSLEGLAAGSLDLAAKGANMRLRYPEGLVATLDADLTLLGNGDEQVLSGLVTLTDAVWTREYDLVSGMLTDREGIGLFDELAGDEVFENLRFDVAIVAPQSLRLRNALAEIDGSAELELRGSVAQPVLLGTTEAERGEVYFLGQRYDITAGKLDFVDPSKIEPFIELTAETRVRSYRVELRLTGTADRFYPELSSDPPLRTVDILRLLSGANERDILIGTEEEEIAGVGVASLLTERLSQELGRRAERLFGLDRFSIDPFLVGQIANPTARVSLGKQITRDLSINYSTNLNATTEAIVLIEYIPEGNMSWILSRDEDGDVGIDVKFRRSF
jgi:autotransporter translocation and assembly factor TamB